MPKNAADRTDGEADDADAAQRRSLSEIRKETRAHPSPMREQLMTAVLRASGELGYRRLTVAAVVERYGGYRLQFYTQFANLSESYRVAYETHSERLCERLLATGAAGASWRAGLREALGALASFATEDPLLARGLLVEVHVAGPPALDIHQEVLERLSGALDRARRETTSRHSPPPLTAPFMVSAIESAVVRALVKGEPQQLRNAMPELEYLTSKVYFGHGAGPT